jgi:16S rRNA processing protein RimM
VVKPQGRRGEVSAELHTDFPERLAERKRLWALTPRGERRELELESCWPHKGRLVLKFRGVDSITAAEALAGCELQIPQQERGKLAPGAVYVSDLVGCVVIDAATGAEIGRVEEVQFGAGEAPLLVLRKGQREQLVPFAADFVKRLDLAGKRVEMLLPDGLLELDAPLTAEEKQRQGNG